MNNSLTILVVEDNQDIRDLLNLTLRANGYCVVMAFDGTHARDLLISGLTPDLILSDIQMPRMSGIELAEIVAKNFSGIPLILMSGQETIADKELQNLNARSFIPKPFDLDFLNSCVADCLMLNRFVKDAV